MITPAVNALAAMHPRFAIPGTSHSAELPVSRNVQYALRGISARGGAS